MRALRPILLIAVLLSVVESIAARSVPPDTLADAAAIEERGTPRPVTDTMPEESGVLFRIGQDLFKGHHVVRDRARGYAQMRLAAMAGFPGAGQALARMRRRISLAERIRANDMLVATLTPPAQGPDVVSKLSAAWSPGDEAAFDAPPDLRPSPVMIHVASTPRKRAAPDAAPPFTRRSAWAVQLGAFRVAGAAERQWSLLGNTVTGLGDLRPRIILAGGVNRLRVTDLDRAGAVGLCSRIVAHGGDCFAIAPRPVAMA